MRKLSIFASAILALGVSGAYAQPYVTGEVTTPNWNPGTGAPIGGGAAADMTIAASAGTDANGIAYTHVLTLPASGPVAHGLTANTDYQWKIADVGFTGTNFPGSNLRIRAGAAVASNPVSFYARTTAFGDGLLPEPNGTALSANAGYAWSTETANFFTTAATWNVLGDFYSASGIAGSANWTENNTSNLVLTDAGYGGATDGVWGVTITGVAAGSYSCKFFDDNTFSGVEMGGNGFGGGNYGFTVLTTSDTVNFILDTRTGRGGVVVTTAAPPVAAGYYVVITGPDATTGTITPGVPDTTNKLPDAGGPAAGVRAKTFTIAAAGSYAARVAYYDGVGATPDASYPSEGIGVPFIATAGQQVIVTFDENTYNDGFFPSKNLVAVLGNSPRATTLTYTEVQAVGNWQSETVDGVVGDFQNNEDTWNLTAQGGGVYAGTFAFNNPSAPAATVNPVQVKAVARITGIAAGILGSGDWSVQIGGADDIGSASGTHNGNGLTLNGNNENLSVATAFANGTSIAITADAVWGRIAANVGAGATAPTAPARPAYFSTVTAVEDWSNY